MGRIKKVGDRFKNDSIVSMGVCELMKRPKNEMNIKND
jgi:hypothetical protein